MPPSRPERHDRRTHPLPEDSATGRRRRAPLGRIVTDSRQVEPGDVFWALRGPTSRRRRVRRRGVPARRRRRRRRRGRSTCRRTAGPSQVDDTQQAPGAMGRLETPAIHRHADRRDRQRGQDHHAADDPHRAASAGWPARPARETSTTTSACPLSMLAIEPEHDYAVLELGASQPGEIAALAASVPAEGRRDHADRRRPPGRIRQPPATSPRPRPNCSPRCRPTARPCWATTPGCAPSPRTARRRSPGSAPAASATCGRWTSGACAAG